MAKRLANRNPAALIVKASNRGLKGRLPNIFSNLKIERAAHALHTEPIFTWRTEVAKVEPMHFAQRIVPAFRIFYLRRAAHIVGSALIDLTIRLSIKQPKLKIF